MPKDWNSSSCTDEDDEAADEDDEDCDEEEEDSAGSFNLVVCSSI